MILYVVNVEVVFGESYHPMATSPLRMGRNRSQSPESSDCVRSKEAKPPRLHWFLFGDNFPGFLVRQVELGHEPPGYYRSEGHEILGPDLESTGMIESTQIPVDSTVGQKLKLHPSQPETPSTAI